MNSDMNANEDKVKLAPPWVVYAGRVEELFLDDPSVHTRYEDCKLIIRVEGADKAEAISALLPQKVEFGNVALEIEVVPSNTDPDAGELFRRAFSGNSKFREVVGGGPMGDVPYALFEPGIVQLEEDDISKYGGVVTLTYEELAASVLDAGDARICSARA